MYKKINLPLKYLLINFIIINFLTYSSYEKFLYQGVKSGNIDVVKAALQAGADVNSSRSKTGDTPLHIAAQEGHTQVVKTLIEAGAEVNVRNSSDSTPLLESIKHRHSPVTRLLVAAQSDVNSKTGRRGPALYEAVESLNRDDAAYLLDANADLSIKGRTGLTPLELAESLYDRMRKSKNVLNESSTGQSKSLRLILTDPNIKLIIDQYLENKWKLKKIIKCNKAVTTLQYPLDQLYFAAGLADGSLNLWITDKDGMLTSFAWSNKLHEKRISALLYIDGENPGFITASDNVIKKSFILDKKIISLYSRKQILALSYCDQNNLLAYEFNVGHINLARGNNISACKSYIEIPEICILALAFSPDGSFLAIADSDNKINLWSMFSDKNIGILGSHELSITVLLWIDDNTLASASQDSTIKIWSLSQRPVFVHAIKGHTAAIKSLIFEPYNVRLISGSYDGEIKIWDFFSARCINTLIGHKRSVNALALSPSGFYLASGSDDGTIIIWENQNTPQDQENQKIKDKCCIIL